MRLGFSRASISSRRTSPNFAPWRRMFARERTETSRRRRRALRQDATRRPVRVRRLARTTARTRPRGQPRRRPRGTRRRFFAPASVASCSPSARSASSCASETRTASARDTRISPRFRRRCAARSARGTRSWRDASPRYRPVGRWRRRWRSGAAAARRAVESDENVGAGGEGTGTDALEADAREVTRRASAATVTADDRGS